MADSSRSQRLSLPVAPLAAGIVGVLTAAMFALVPTYLLESMVVDSGVASVLSAAEPPLGGTARLALVLLCGGGTGLMSWFALFLLFGSRTIVVQRGASGNGGVASAPADAPVLRRADAHPDAPARRPLFANTDLGTPFLDVRARPVHVDAAAVAARPRADMLVPPDDLDERPIPADLDQPLAAYDRAALPEAPLSWEVTVPKPEPRPTPPESDERLETSPLTPIVRPEPAREPNAEPHPAADSDSAPVLRHIAARVSEPLPPRAKADPSETIQTLLDRLEQVTARRARTPVAPPAESIEDTLSSLRRMATGAR